MFEWLEAEISQIKTAKFHVFERAKLDDKTLSLTLPPSLLFFLMKFGSARLYREGSSYLVSVHSPPEVITWKDGERLVYFGFSSKYGRAYFRNSQLATGVEVPVFEYDPDDPGTVLQQGASNFSEWLALRCADARDMYSRKQWAEIERGPKPFTRSEKAIVEARRLFKWSVVGISESGDIRFRVRNESELTLPYLSIGVRAKDGSLSGGLWLPVGEIAPHQEKVIEKEAYKKLIDPQHLEFFEKPDPDPEDRERYWEFR